MTVGLRCERCSRFDPNARFYSYEQADQAALWEHWSCSNCRNETFVLTSSVPVVPPRVMAAQHRLSAVLRALDENCGPHLSVSDLTDDAIIEVDGLICAIVKDHIPARIPRFGPVETAALAVLPPLVKPGASLVSAKVPAGVD